jgi:hypothetical protein
MLRPVFSLKRRTASSTIRCFGLALTIAAAAQSGLAQDTPLISGGGGFFTSTNAGKTTYLPIVEPLLAAPLGQHVLVESRAALLESISQTAAVRAGYNHSALHRPHLPARRLHCRRASPHRSWAATISFPSTPTTSVFLQSGLAISGWSSDLASRGLFSGSGLGGMLRGNAIQRSNTRSTTAYFYSVRSGNEQFSAHRGTGGAPGFTCPSSALKWALLRSSLARDARKLLRRITLVGAEGHCFPPAFRVRARSSCPGLLDRSRLPHQGIWRPRQCDRPYRARLPHTADLSPRYIASDGLPPVNMQRADFGLDYNLPHNTRILTSYARQFSATGNHNVWETGIVYRFLFPAWKGR